VCRPPECEPPPSWRFCDSIVGVPASFGAHYMPSCVHHDHLPSHCCQCGARPGAHTRGNLKWPTGCSSFWLGLAKQPWRLEALWQHPDAAWADTFFIWQVTPLCPLPSLHWTQYARSLSPMWRQLGGEGQRQKLAGSNFPLCAYRPC